MPVLTTPDTVDTILTTPERLSSETFRPKVTKGQNPPWAVKDWLLLGLILVAGYALFFHGLNAFPLFDVDEPRYAEAAREMLESGNWITPYFNYELRFDKPVLFYWLIAWSYQLFGISEASARLVSAIAALSSTISLFLVGRAVWNRRFGVLSALIFATSIQVASMGRMSITDMTLATFLSATILALFGVVAQSPRWWLLAGVFSGLGILTKGPVGIVLPGLVMVVYLSIESFLPVMSQLKPFNITIAQRWQTVFLNRHFVGGVAIALAISIPWFLLCYQENGQIFWDALFHHNVSRFSGGVDYHIKPWWFFVPVVAVGFLPWTFWLPAAANAVKQWVSGSSLKNQQGLDSKKQTMAQYVVYGAVWAVTVFMFFTISQTKLLTYVQCLYGSLAIVLAAVVEMTDLQKKTPNLSPKIPGLNEGLTIWLTLTAVLMGASLLFGSVIPISTIFPSGISPELNLLVTSPMIPVVLSLLFAGAIVSWAFAKKQWFQAAVVTQLSAMILITPLAFTTLMPLVNHVTQGAMQSFLKISAGKPLAIYEITRPSLTYYKRQHIPHVARGDYAKLETLLSRSAKAGYSGLYVITKISLLSDFKQQLPPKTQFQVIEQRSPYVLTLCQSRSSTNGQ